MRSTLRAAIIFALVAVALAVGGTAAVARGAAKPSDAAARPTVAAADDVVVTPPPDGNALPGTPTPPVAGAPPAPPVAEPTPATTDDTKKDAKPTAGWVKGSGFVLQSDDGAYKLRIGLQAGYKFEPVRQNGDDQSRSTFFVLRPILAGNFFRDWIHFWTSFEFASNPPYLLDSYVEIQPIPEAGVRIGQQFTPFDRHEYLGPQQILFPEWAPVSEYFWTGRDKGITFMGAAADTKVEYWAGAYSGTPLRQYTALSGNYVAEGRITVSPLGPMGDTEFPYIAADSDAGAPFRVSATLQGYYGHVQSAEENFNPSTFRFTVTPTGDLRRQTAGGIDFNVQGGRFVFFAESMVRHTEPSMGANYTSLGAWGQVGVMLLKQTLDAGVRVNWLNPSLDLTNDQFYSIEGQVAYYISHSPNLVIKLRYGYGHQNTPGMDALGAVALVTDAGTTQLITTQLNLMF